MYNNNPWRNPFAPTANQIPLTREKTIREELEEQFRLEEERQRQQSLIPQPDYSHLSLREELEARFRDLENQQNNQNITPIPPTQPAMPEQILSQPENRLNDYLPSTNQTPVPANLNITQLSPQQLNSSLLPQPIQKYPLTLPKQISSTPPDRVKHLLKNMEHISYDYSESPKINDIIDYAMTGLAYKMPNPFLQKALTHHQDLYKLASRFGVGAAQKNVAFLEGLQQIITLLINKNRDEK